MLLILCGSKDVPFGIWWICKAIAHVNLGRHIELALPTRWIFHSQSQTRLRPKDGIGVLHLPQRIPCDFVPVNGKNLVAGLYSLTFRISAGSHTGHEAAVAHHLILKAVVRVRHVSR